MTNRTMKGVWTLGVAVFFALGPADIAGAELSGQRPGPNVSANLYHSLMIRSDGTVWQSGWVLQDPAECDKGVASAFHFESEPVQIPGRRLTDIVAVSAGRTHSLALDVNGRIYAWGCNYSGQLGNGTHDHSPYADWVEFDAKFGERNMFVAIAAGWQNSYALKADGTVWSWGMNGHGNLGNDGGGKDATLPVQVPLENVVGIAAGDFHALAWTSSGALYGWGLNNMGQLGIGTRSNMGTPQRILGSGIVQASGAFGHTLARTVKGEVLGWGSNSSGQLGHEPAEFQEHCRELNEGFCVFPLKIMDMDGVIQVEAGGSSSFVTTGGGEIWAWGRNDYHHLGILPPLVNGNVYKPKFVISGQVGVSAGG